MALTKLDTHAALLVIDMQKGLAGMPLAHPFAEVLARIAELARAFRESGQTVVLVNVDGPAPGRTDAGRPNFQPPPNWTELMPELGHTAADVTVTKQRWGAFLGTQLDQDLRRRGVTQVFMTGVATSAGVESTARSAFDLGYNVVFVTDAITDRDPATHEYCLDKVFPRLGERESAALVLQAVEASFRP